MQMLYLAKFTWQCPFKEWDFLLQETEGLDKFKYHLALMKLLFFFPLKLIKIEAQRTVWSRLGDKSISPNTAGIQYLGCRSVRKSCYWKVPIRNI